MHEPGSCERPDLSLAVVVGAGGMARAIARRLGHSYRLLIADRDADVLDSLAVALKQEGVDAQTHCCDITSDDDVASLVARAGDLGPPRVLVHVVGLSPSMGDFDAIIAVNLIGARRIERAFLPLAMSGSCAIFISSMGGHMDGVTPPVQSLMDGDPLVPGFGERFAQAVDQPGTPNLAYQLSKFAMNRMCRREAFVWGQRGARIISLSPGLIATPMGALEFERQPMKYDLLSATPLQREGTMAEISGVVEFLASDRASFITGTDILVDGGLVAALRHPVR
ncbi:MAG TPA: SDR family oxidoreductase [Novosphingobium sp.]